MAVRVVPYKEWIKKRTECPQCNARLEYGEEDTWYDSCLLHYNIECPECGEEVYVGSQDPNL